MVVYKLNRDMASVDLIHEPFKDDGKAIYFWSGVVKGRIPNPFYCYGDLTLLENKHLPTFTTGIPVFSDKLLDALISLGEFRYESRKLSVIDVSEKEHLYGKMSKEVNVKVNTSFSIIKLLDNLDVFDYDNSEYKRQSFNPELPGVISKLVLKEPDIGFFPPVFKLLEMVGFFITEETKNVIESQGIFIDLDKVPVTQKHQA